MIFLLCFFTFDPHLFFWTTCLLNHVLITFILSPYFLLNHLPLSLFPFITFLSYFLAFIHYLSELHVCFILDSTAVCIPNHITHHTELPLPDLCKGSQTLPEDSNCDACQNVGTCSAADTTYLQKLKFYIFPSCFKTSFSHSVSLTLK
jgi:hypothetical protein